MRLIFATAALAALAACSGANNASTAKNTTTTTNAVTTAPSPRAAAHVIKIGIDLPLSGGDASVGISTEQGALLAIEQMQKQMPAGYSLQSDALDDAVQGVHNPEQGVSNIRTFVSDASVLAVVGPYNSNVARAEIPVTNAAGLLQIGPSVVADNLTIGPDAAQLRRANPQLNTFFRVCTTDSRQGTALAQFARSLGYKRAYIVDDNETYGLDLANRFESDFTADGGTVLARDHLAKNTQDFKSLLLKVAAAKPDVLFFGGVTSTGGGLIRKQMFTVGLGKLPYLGGDGLADLATGAGGQADGSYFTLAAPDATKLSSAQSFIKAYRKRYGSDAGPYSANAYAAAQIASEAILRSIPPSRDAVPSRTGVVRAVAAAKQIQTPIGTISFDSAGDVTHPILSLYGFKNGSPYFIRQINVR